MGLTSPYRVIEPLSRTAFVATLSRFFPSLLATLRNRPVSAILPSSDFSIKLMFEMSKMKRTISSSFHLIDQKFLCSIYVQSRSFFPQRDGNLRTQGRARLLRAPPYWPFLPARATSCSSKFAPPIISTVFSRKGNRCSRISSGWKFIESLLL